jgi:hypothetical protein
VWSGLTWTWARAGSDMARRAAVDGNEVGGHRRWGGCTHLPLQVRVCGGMGNQGVDVAGIGAIFDMANVGRAVGVEVAGNMSRLTSAAPTSLNEGRGARAAARWRW